MSNKEGLFNAETGSYTEILPSNGYDVIEWHPTSDASGPATAVCLVLPFTVRDIEANIMLRLKSRRAITELIDALEKHRNSVWKVS